MVYLIMNNTLVDNIGYFECLEKQIRSYYTRALNILKIPHIPLYCKQINNVYDTGYSHYNLNEQSICILMHDPELICSYYCKTEKMDNRDINIFTLFHEIGHYWHFTQHNTHFDKYRQRYHDISYFSDTEGYNKQNIEKHANNIAKILYNKLYKIYE